MLKGVQEGRGKQFYRLPCNNQLVMYEGFFHGGKRWGKGRIIFWNGDIYDGDWVRNKCEGYGTYIKYNGDKFHGEWFRSD